ncbi:MAG: ATPase, T2SS/T4P/T4SS family [Thermoanaerobacterales bacterium]|nr:ATPase, T2SS/T4P/T4SS family [Thermoanaerobacterales bacterium]
MKLEEARIVQDLSRQIMRESRNAIGGPLPLEALEHLVRQAVVSRPDIAPVEEQRFVDMIIGQATGYGPLKPFFIGEAAEEITEVFINPPSTRDQPPRVFIAKHGRIHQVNETVFANDEEVRQFCQRICESVGRPFTADAPIVDAWLPDGSRIAVMGYKVSPLGTVAAIRKSPLRRPPMPLDKLVAYGAFPPFVAGLMVDLLVKGRANLGIWGRTDSGKTTVMRSLGAFIDTSERVIIAEPSFELALPHLPNCVNLVEVYYGQDAIVSMTQICKAVNRNTPDRGIVAEIRSQEAIDASQIAASTPCGFWTSGHAGGVPEFRSRIYGMWLNGKVQLPMEFLDEIIRSMFHFLIFLDKDSAGQRALMSIVEVTSDGYRPIVEFDEQEFLRTKGKVRRWCYRQTVTPERLARLAFRGAEIKPEYQAVHREFLNEEV